MTTTAVGVTAGPINNTGSAATISSTSGTDGTFVSSHEIVTARPPQDAISESTAVGLDSFFQFDVSADPGMTIDLSSLTFGGYKGGDSDPRGWVLRSSLDAFGADISTGVITSNSFGGGSTEPDPFVINLSGATYQGLSDIAFRIYAYAPTAGFAVNFTDIELNGSVPEPSSTLLSLASMSVFGLRRRRNSK